MPERSYILLLNSLISIATHMLFLPLINLCALVFIFLQQLDRPFISSIDNSVLTSLTNLLQSLIPNFTLIFFSASTIAVFSLNLLKFLVIPTKRELSSFLVIPNAISTSARWGLYGDSKFISNPRCAAHLFDFEETWIEALFSFIFTPPVGWKSEIFKNCLRMSRNNQKSEDLIVPLLITETHSPLLHSSSINVALFVWFVLIIGELTPLGR